MNSGQRTAAMSLAVLLAVVLTASAPAAETDDPRDLAVDAVNQQPAFMVRVDVDRPDRTYHEGDEINVTVRSERAGRLYLLYCDAGQQVTCLFPNRAQSDNRIPAKLTVRVPGAGARFRLAVGPPFGREVLKAIVTTEPLEALELEKLTQKSFTPVSTDRLKRVFVEVLDEEAPADDAEAKADRLWAEHHVEITTAPREESTAAAQPAADSTSEATEAAAVESQPAATTTERPKRFGVFIGISKYEDQGIRPLRVADRDAQAMAEVMRECGQMDDGAVLLNENATLANIRQLLQKELPSRTRPGDVVLLYWSGHGGRVSNLDGSESDGYDEYLVPYDGRLEPADAVRSTMLLDKTFGRWVQDLDGRKLIVVIDACHSGGQTRDAVKALRGGDDRTPFRKFFFASAWRRTKDIGQRETAVLASSQAAQISLERRDGELSVMTHFLVDRLRRAGGSVTLLEAAEYLQSAVPAFVEQHYPGTTQTPVFANQTTPPVYLRP